MVGTGRKPEGTRIEVRIPDDVLAAVDAYATANGLKRAAAIRQLLREATK